MHLDFASEYARRSDEEIRMLIQDRHNLVDEARDALDTEVHKRRSKGFQTHVHEPEEPRTHVEEDDEDGNEVFVRSRELKFPKICPRCLAPADSFVRISCDGGSSWGLIPALDFVVGLWRYLFFRYPVPFCKGCAISVRIRRWVERLFMLGVIASSVFLWMRYHMSAVRCVVTFVCLYLAGVAFWLLSGMPRRWPSAGIEILSAWSARDRRLALANPAYEKAFVALNKGTARRE
jgi:hypothetical protein